MVVLRVVETGSSSSGGIPEGLISKDYFDPQLGEDQESVRCLVEGPNLLRHFFVFNQLKVLILGGINKKLLGFIAANSKQVVVDSSLNKVESNLNSFDLIITSSNELELLKNALTFFSGKNLPEVLLINPFVRDENLAGYQEPQNFYTISDARYPKAVFQFDFFKHADQVMRDLLYLTGNDQGISDFLSSNAPALALFVSDGALSKLMSFDTAETAREIGWHYSSNREIPTKTVFSLSADNSVYVTTAAIKTNDNNPRRLVSDDFSVIWKPETGAPLQKQRSFLVELLRDAECGRWNSFESKLHHFLVWSAFKWQTSKEHVLDGQALDAVLANSFIKKRADKDSPFEFDLIDLEWELIGDLPEHYFIFRNCISLAPYVSRFSSEIEFANLKEMYESFCLLRGLEPDFKSVLSLEQSFQRAVLCSSLSLSSAESVMVRKFKSTK